MKPRTPSLVDTPGPLRKLLAEIGEGRPGGTLPFVEDHPAGLDKGRGRYPEAEGQTMPALRRLRRQLGM